MPASTKAAKPKASIEQSANADQAASINLLSPSWLLPRVDALIQLLCLIAISITPLLFSQRATELFEFPKMALVYVIACALLSLLVFQWLINRQLVIRYSFITWLILLFLGWLLITGMAGQHIYTSLAGYYTRFNGGLASFIAYSVIAYAIFEQIHRLPDHGRAFIFRILGSWLVAAGIVSVWGILEHFGHDPSCLILQGNFDANCWVEDVQARVFSTFGQPNWLAMYLVATISVAIGMLLSLPPRQKLLVAIGILLSYAAFWYTYSRSGWVGLIAALLIIILFTPWSLLWQHRWWLIGLIVGCALISISSFDSAALRAETSLSGRGADTSTGSIRLMVWQGTGKIIAHHPLLGTGPGTFAYSFLPFRPVEMNNTTEWNFLYNEAHNQALNTAATTGLPGSIIWLTLCFIPIVRIWRRSPLNTIVSRWAHLATKIRAIPMVRSISRSVTTGTEKTPVDINNIHIGLVAGIVGVFAGQLFGFAVVMTNLLLFVALAIIFAPGARIRKIRLRGWREFAGYSFAVLTIVTIWVVAVRYISAELNIKQGDITASINSFQSLNYYQKAVTQNPWEPNYRIKLAGAYINSASISNDPDSARQQADNQLAQAMALNPRDLIISKGATYYYRHMANNHHQFKTEALQAAEHSVSLAPTDADARRTLANIQQEFGQTVQARASYNQLIQLRPKAADSYLQRAQFFQQQNDLENMRRDAQQALKLDPNNAQAKKLLSEM